LDGKAAYRAITKWLENEYPYFAAATKEGKDGWENSTRHTLSSHRAFIKIDRKPEERGKGCFWSFDPDFEEQFKDQWRAAESQARNPRVGGRPPNPPPPPGSGPNGHAPPPPGVYPRPPFGQAGPGPGWSGVTPPHLMPGYRPMVPGAPPGPYTFPPGAPRPPGMLPHPPMHPLGHPLGIPPLLSSGTSPLGKARAPKKPKQALGAAFSRAPLIRPGLGGVPPKGEGTATSSVNGRDAADEAVRRGEHVVRMAARAAKDELSGRAPPGTTLVAATGGWGMGAFPPQPPPPIGSVNGKAKSGNLPLPAMGMPARPSATAKIEVVLGLPPPEALPPAFSQQPPASKEAKAGSSSTPEDGSKSPDATSTSPAPKPPFQTPIIMPMTFFKGTLFLDPSAYPYLDAEDVSKMRELGIGEAMQYLLAKSSGSRAGLSPSAAPATDESKKASESPERDVKDEEIGRS
jgi:Forkhead domain